MPKFIKFTYDVRACLQVVDFCHILPCSWIAATTSAIAASVKINLAIATEEQEAYWGTTNTAMSKHPCIYAIFNRIVSKFLCCSFHNHYFLIN